MSALLEKAAKIPPHVPLSLVFDFDLYHLAGLESGESEDLHVVWKHMQDTHPPLFWTPHYGGHWVATRTAEIKRLQEDHAYFSNFESFIPRGVIPFQLPVQMDPPEHGKFRRIFTPAFLPRALVDIEAKARRIAIAIIEQLQPQGGCEFVRDFAGTIPIQAFLTMMGLPDADYRFLRDLAIYMSKPTHPKSPAAWAEISAYLRGWIAKRRLEPGTDLISTILQSKVDDRPLTGDEAFSLCLLMLGGGLDTMVSMTTFIACFLAQNPAHRQELRGHPEKIDVAVEEFARRFGTSNLGRNIVQPTDLCGQTLLAGDIIVIPNPLFGLDETQNENPLNVDFNRAPPRHAAFGNGVHTCPGAVLARREIKIFLQEWLTRIPEFSIKPGTRPKVTTGLVNAMGELHLVWPV